MKTLADFKRELTLGSIWEGYNWIINVTLGIREVAIVQRNGVAFMNPKTNNHSWLYFPKAENLKINNGIVEIYSRDNGKLLLTYQKVQK